MSWRGKQFPRLWGMHISDAIFMFMEVEPCGNNVLWKECLFYLPPAAEGRGLEIIKRLPSVRASVRHVFA